MEKLLESYIEKYGTVPKDFYERFLNLLNDNNIKNTDIKKIRKEIKRIQNIKKERLYFTFFLEPSSCPRPRLNRSFKGKRNFVFVKGAREHKDLFDLLMKEVGNYPIITTPCKLNIEIFSPTPSSMNKVEKILAELKLISNISKPDFDNYAKRYSDMIQATLISDDSLVVESHIKKKYSCKPRIEIIVEYLTEHECRFNEKKINKRK